MKALAFCFTFCLLALVGFAQEQPAHSPQGATPEGTPVRVENGVPLFTMAEVRITAERMSRKERQAYLKKLKNYEKLRANIKLVYLLAKQCAKIVNEIDAELKGPGKKKEKKYFMEKLEKELFVKYEPQLRNMTISQGRLLAKLVHRECGSSAYQLIEEYKSWRSAAFWQLVAKFFGTNLKDTYNPNEEQAIEMIIQQIESGDADGYVIVYQ
jgi:hypothetical protein